MVAAQAIIMVLIRVVIVKLPELRFSPPAAAL
jgi:hypothetical protein